MEAQKMWWRRLNLGRSKLKASARASALLSGFAMVALVEIQLNNESEVPVVLLVCFVICTTLLIAVHMLALMIATCILPHIESVAIIPGTTEYSANDGTHDRLRNYIEMSWFFSTTIGIFLFLVEIDLICWVKFWNYGVNSGTNLGKIASISVTIALIPIFILFITFAVKFYQNLVTHQFEKSEREILELDSLINQLNLHGGDRRESDLSAVVAAAVLQQHQHPYQHVGIHLNQLSPLIGGQISPQIMAAASNQLGPPDSQQVSRGSFKRSPGQASSASSSQTAKVSPAKMVTPTPSTPTRTESPSPQPPDNLLGGDRIIRD